MTADLPSAELLTDVVWTRPGDVWLERCRLSRLPSGYALEGLVLAVHEARPLEARYVVFCDPGWHTRAVHMDVSHGSRVRRLELERDEAGSWRQGAARIPEFDGLIDVDLQVSPSTNTLPIRRLGLDDGEGADVDALWIRFPELTLERLPQRYTRRDAGTYTYESRGGSFRAELDVDEHGVVIRYGDIWQRPG